MWDRLSIPAKFMIIAAASIVVGLATIFGSIVYEENGRILENAHSVSLSELMSVRDLSVQTMTTRPVDSEDIGIKMYNSWFDRRNQEYDGKLWTVWGPKVADWQKEVGSPVVKPPQDAVDEEALATGQLVGRRVGDTYRLSMPVVLGVTAGAEQQVCFDCHEPMNMVKGDALSVLSSLVDLKDEYAALTQRVIIFVVIWVVVVIIAILGTYATLSVIVTKPIEGLNRAMRGLAAGQLEAEISGQARQDSIGEMARSVQVFKENLLKNRDMTRQQETQQEAERARVARIEHLTGDFEVHIGEVVQAISTAAAGMRHAAQALAANAERASGDAEAVATSSDRAAGNSESAAEATDDLARSISEIESRIQSASTKARDGVDKAQKTNETVSRLSEGAKQIGHVIDLINDIAERTNLLALNATVEAARAGEAGKGFAVVASEVQNLANQTKKATDSISREVQQVRAATTDAVAAIQAVAQTVGEIDAISAEVAAAVEAQNRATGEIAQNVKQAATGAREITSSIMTLSEAAANTDQGATEVLSAAEGLTRQSQILHEVVEKFISNVRKS